MKPSLTWSRGGGVGRWRCFIQKLGKNPVRARFFLLPSASVGNRFKWNGKRRTPVSCSTKIGRLLFYSKPNKTQLKPRKTFVSKPVFLCEPPWNVVFHFEKKTKKNWLGKTKIGFRWQTVSAAELIQDRRKRKQFSVFLCRLIVNGATEATTKWPPRTGRWKGPPSPTRWTPSHRVEVVFRCCFALL